MRRFSPVQKITVGAITAVAAVGLLIFITSQRTNTRAPESAATPKPSGNATANEPKDYNDGTNPTPSPTQTSGATPTPVVAAPTPAKPTLQLSSGNGGTVVPVGRGMEFTCESSPGYTCKLVLTDRKNPARVIDMGVRTITSNGRGQYWASWQWSALAGSWSLVATASNGGGGTTASDPVTLEVQ